MSAGRVVLWRHGRTAWNAGERFQGQTDTDLDDVGIAQAAEAAGMLAGTRPAAVVASDLRRAARTAAALAALTGLPVATDPDLRELDAGAWQGRLRHEIEQRWPQEFAAWQSGEDVAVGGGERRSDVGARTAAAVERHADGLDARDLLVVASHGGALRGAMLQMLGLPLAAWGAFSGLANTHWAVLERRAGGEWRLAEYNVGPAGAHVGSEG